MLHTAEEPVSVIQNQHFLARKKIQLAQRSQRLEHCWFLQERMTRSVDKLQGLHDEFDLANTATSKFHVAFQFVRAHDVALDAPFDTGDFIQQIRRRAFGVNKRMMLPQKFVGQFPAAADSARLDQRKTFPGFAEAGVIIFHALERAGQWSGRAFRSETQIDTKERASRMPGRKCFEDSFSHAVKEFMIGNMSGELAFLTVEKKKINVRAVIQLPAAKLAQCKNGELRLRRTILLPQFRVPMFEHVADANFRHLRKLAGGFLERCDVCKLAKSDARHLTSLPKTKSRKTQVCERVASRSLQIAQHFRIAARCTTDLRLAKPQKAVRVVREAGRANTGNSKKMKQGCLAQRKLFDHIGKGPRGFRPMFGKMNQDGFDVCRVN